MISADEAKRTIEGCLKPIGVEICGVGEGLRRVLANDIVSDQDIPPFDNSSMDGYAIRTADVRNATADSGIRLSIQGEVAAGRIAQNPLLKDHAYRILTGAPVPDGADAVIEQELTEHPNGAVTVHLPVGAGRNIRRRGEDIKTGSVVLQKGARLTPAHLGVLASLGRRQVTVYRKPQVSLLTTGDELVEFEDKLEPGKIRNSNGTTLEGLVRESGGTPRPLGIARDNESELRKKILAGLEADVLVTSGGVSVGDRDYVLDFLKAVGVRILFWKINIKPGMPMAFGLFEHTDGRQVPVFALPGNPVSSMVTYLQFVRPGIEKMEGCSEVGSRIRLEATLAEDLRKADGKRHFVRGVYGNQGGKVTVVSTGSQSSGVLTSLTRANCLIILPEEVRDPKAGTVVEIELL